MIANVGDFFLNLPLEILAELCNMGSKEIGIFSLGNFLLIWKYFLIFIQFREILLGNSLLAVNYSLKVGENIFALILGKKGTSKKKFQFSSLSVWYAKTI